MSLPKYGRTKQAHVEALLTDAAATVSATFDRIVSDRRLSPAERDELSRRLAGVISDCEATRIWLGCGAPK